jgi:hypothetical protein
VQIQRSQLVKRRVHDVINVMQGVGLIEKHPGRVLHYRLTPPYAAAAPAIAEATRRATSAAAELAMVVAEESKIDKRIADMHRKIDALRASGDGAWTYVTPTDIKGLGSLFAFPASSSDGGGSVAGDERREKRGRFMGITCPSGTVVDVPDPSHGMGAGEERHVLFLKSPGPDRPIRLVFADPPSPA